MKCYQNFTPQENCCPAMPHHWTQLPWKPLATLMGHLTCIKGRKNEMEPQLTLPFRDDWDFAIHTYFSVTAVCLSSLVTHH